MTVVGGTCSCYRTGIPATSGRDRLCADLRLHEGRSRSPTASSRASQTRHVGKHLDIRKQQSLAPRPDARIGLTATARSRAKLLAPRRVSVFDHVERQ